jgi:hypothetical protein
VEFSSCRRRLDSIFVELSIMCFKFERTIGSSVLLWLT